MRALHLRNLTSFPTRRSSDLATDHAWTLISDQGVGAPTEEVVAQGLEESKKFIRVLVEAQRELAGQSAKEVQEFPLFPDYADDAYAAVEAEAADSLSEALSIAGKAEREDRMDEIKDQMLGALQEGFDGREKELSAAYRALTKKLIRKRILTDSSGRAGLGEREIGQRDPAAAVIPRVHRSASYERVEPQILDVTTLNMLKREQQLDPLAPQTRKRYMHISNFPPYSTGETGR